MWQEIMPPGFVVSLGYIFITAIIMKFVRTILLKKVTDSYRQTILLEFLATFELLATVFELGVVIEKQGFVHYTALMLILFNYWGTAFKSATASPHPHILNVFQRKSSLKTSLTIIFSQLLAATLVYNLYVKPIWSFGYRSTHLQRIRASRCHTHLQVPVPLGILIEATATFGFSFALKILENKRYKTVALPLILVSIVYTGLTYTGCYFNPILATTIQFGCNGITPVDHILVYWLGPILGAASFTVFSKLIIDKSNNFKKML